MKTNYLLLLTAILVCGCESKENQPEVIEVGLTLNYSLPQSGSMTKGPSDVYDAFYDAHIATRQLLPDYYDLIFYNKSGDNVAELTGYWSSSSLVRLPVGQYNVVGMSKGGSNFSDDFSKAPLSFNEEITVSATMSNLTLHAQYNCFLLLFDEEGKTNMEWSADGKSYSGTSGSAPKLDGLYYLFVQGFKDTGYVKWYNGSKPCKINMTQFDFQNGYYYYFNDLTSTFEVPKMQQGSN